MMRYNVRVMVAFLLTLLTIGFGALFVSNALASWGFTKDVSADTGGGIESQTGKGGETQHWIKQDFSTARSTANYRLHHRDQYRKAIRHARESISKGAWLIRNRGGGFIRGVYVRGKSIGHFFVNRFGWYEMRKHWKRVGFDCVVGSTMAYAIDEYDSHEESLKVEMRHAAEGCVGGAFFGRLP